MRAFALDRRFGLAIVADNSLREHDWSPVGTDPATGRPMERRVRVRLDADHRRLHGVMTYREIGSEAVTELPYESLVLRPDAYHRLFRAAGFESEVFVGYEARADDGEDPILCFVAAPGG